MNTPRLESSSHAPELPRRGTATTLASLGLAIVFTLAALHVVDALATTDAGAPQLAQASTPRG